MNFLPASKIDLQATEHLDVASDEEITPHLKELMTWLQDINWPVSMPVALRLAKCGIEIAPYIDEILKGDDEIWKFNVLYYLIPKLKPEVMEASMDEVVRIINCPTESEIKEELHKVAMDTGIIYSHSV